LIEACKALDDARSPALTNRDKAEWRAFHRFVCNALFDLCDKLLDPVYEQYPDLLEQEAPMVSSKLTW